MVVVLRGGLRAGFGGGTEREQMNDVGLRKGRVRCVLGLQLIGGATEAQADVVLLHRGVQIEVDDRLRL